MLYDCASIALSALSTPKNGDTPDLINTIASEFSRSTAYFRFPIIDVGANSAMAAPGELLYLIDHLTRAGYVTRVLTSGQHFVDFNESCQQVRDMVRLGVTRVILRLDPTLVLTLSDTTLANYVSACIESGLNAEMRFEFDDDLPETFFDIIRKIEQLRFYTKLYPFKKRLTTRYAFDLSTISSVLHMGQPRLVISEDKAVLLRVRGAVYSDFMIGYIDENQPLSEMICPARLLRPQERRL
ncbi:MAG TPA: hypothetical protein VME45_11750 [Stellaceae bacterium]|nr:hypothetical protein [Stellaceae bacterium]